MKLNKSRKPQNVWVLDCDSLFTQGLVELGVVLGGDMTVECALTKVAFVMGLEELTLEERKSVSLSLKCSLIDGAWWSLNIEWGFSKNYGQWLSAVNQNQSNYKGQSEQRKYVNSQWELN